MKQFTFIVFALKVSFSSEFLFTQSGKVRESYKSFQMFNGKSCCYNFLITNFWKCKSYRFKVNTRDIQGLKWRNDIIQNMYICIVYINLCISYMYVCIPYTVFGNCCKSENRDNWLGTFLCSPFVRAFVEGRWAWHAPLLIAYNLHFAL